MQPPRIRDRLASNPFFVLGLPTTAGRAEIEREGQKLLAMLELGLSKAMRYATPVGEQTRTVDLVRSALAALRDPATRLHHELWARIGSAEIEVAPAPTAAANAHEGSAWAEALYALGWGRRP